MPRSRANADERARQPWNDGNNVPALRDVSPRDMGFLLKLAAGLKTARYAGTAVPRPQGRDISDCGGFAEIGRLANVMTLLDDTAGTRISRDEGVPG